LQFKIRLFFFGGYSFGAFGGSSYNDLHILNTTSMAWEILPVPKSAAPSPRHLFSSEVVIPLVKQMNIERACIYGGTNGKQNFNDAYILHIDASSDEKSVSWSQPHVVGEAPALCGHTASIIGNRMFVLGGVANLKQNNDGENSFKAYVLHNVCM